jgi:peptidoglycan/xylan/chitin deacetylase (PgdA/CDA1 family)
VSRPLVLCYHAVSDHWEHKLAVRTLAFERQLRSLLRRRFRPATATQALAGRGRLLHVTFDDAFTSVARNAAPVLERIGVPATVFAAADFAADGRPLDVPELADEARAHPGHLATMRWDELRGLAQRGFEIGSHTVSHAHLRELGDEELRRELRDSRERCEAELERPCRLLAYPFGEHDLRVQAAVRHAGYEAAFALRAGTSRTNPFAQPRVDFYRGDSLARATVKTSFLRPTATGLVDLARAAFR